MIQSQSKFKKPAVIINLASGSTTDISDDILNAFAAHDMAKPTFHIVESSQLRSAFQTIARDGTDLIVIYGGDGTCKAGATVAKDLDIPFAALPGGTMNMLPKALYGTDAWQDALKLALETKEPRWFPAARMNKEVFFCGAIIGDPIKMSDAREAVRDGTIMEAIKQVPEVVAAITDGDTFTYKVDGRDYVRNTNLLYLSSPKTLKNGNELTFELASIPRMSLKNLLDVGARTLVEGWRESEHVHVDHVKTISISGQGKFETLLDGEPTQVSCPINISLERKGVKVLAPKTLP